MADHEDIPTIRESLRDGARQVGDAVNALFGVGAPILVLAFGLGRVFASDHRLLALVLLGGVATTVVTAGMVLRHRPATTGRLATFGFVATLAFQGGVLAVPWLDTSPDPPAPEVYVPSVLLVWTVAVGLAGTVVFRDAARTFASALPGVGRS